VRDLVFRVHAALNSIDKSLAVIAKALTVLADVAEGYRRPPRPDIPEGYVVMKQTDLQKMLEVEEPDDA
jgi:hypothetical protein